MSTQYSLSHFLETSIPEWPNKDANDPEILVILRMIFHSDIVVVVQDRPFSILVIVVSEIKAHVVENVAGFRILLQLRCRQT